MEKVEKKVPPPYTTYKSFLNFINNLRDGGLPTHITRTMLPGSNSGKATMAASLRSLGLVTEGDEPTEIMRRLTSPTENYGKVLQEVMVATYEFLSDPAFDFGKTTTDKVVEKIKAAGAGGSTVTKCIAFLLSACQDAGIEVSKYVKSPAPVRGSVKKRAQNNGKKAGEPVVDEIEDSDPLDDTPDGMERITVPLRNMEDGVIFFPSGLSKDEARRAVKAAVFNLTHYYELDEEDGG